MSGKTKVPSMKALEGYSDMSDAAVVTRGSAVVMGLTGNSNFSNLPVDLATLQSNH